MEANINQKSQLTSMVNSQGWEVAQHIADQILKEIEQAALRCEDDEKVLALSRKARGAREFWDSFIENVNTLREPTSTELNEF